MATTSDLIDETRRWLQSSQRPEYNRLTDPVDDTASSVTLDFALGSIAPGAVLGVELEEVYVWAAATPSATSVQRGWNGSTATAHDAGTVVAVNPMFSDWRIFNEINNELVSLSSQVNGLYQVKTVTHTATVASSYDLASDAVDILAVQWNDFGPSLDWPRIRRWDYLANQDTSVFPSGIGLQLYTPPPPGRTLRITYAANFGTLSALADDVQATTGLPASANDIPAIGAAARLLSARESRRSQVDAQPEGRQAQDVPPGAARSSAASLFALRAQRIKEEAARLSSTYPTVMRPAV